MFPLLFTFKIFAKSLIYYNIIRGIKRYWGHLGGGYQYEKCAYY
nr:MAG TPA: hypothetical protein [Caudoviricetes sp.]